MKRIAIFCDGTWNRADARHPTNVVWLSRVIAPLDDAGNKQEVRYLEGVGTGRGSNRFSRFLDRAGGGAFGWGLNRNVELAYEALAEIYQPEDEILVFGFSRGAYTARSLVGLIRNCGLPVAETRGMIREALDHYRSREKDDHPNSDKTRKFRAEYSPAVCPNETDRQWRIDNGYPDCRLMRISYVGVWDTVGALGVPALFGGLSKELNRKYEFHDTELSSSVQGARHAVSIDEDRSTFPPTLWTNFEDLNADAAPQRPYQQQWFPGGHGSVGGGGELRGLSDAALHWVGEGASDAGLKFADGALEAFRGGADVLAPLDNTKKKPGAFWKLLARAKKVRAGPDDMASVSDMAARRWRVEDPPRHWDGRYRPRPLRRLSELLSRVTDQG